MTEVQFTQDYRGHLTNENYYTAGTVARFADGVAAQLVQDGRAVYTSEIPQQPEPSAIIGTTSAAVPAVNLSGLTVAELRELAKAAEVDGYYKMKKADLIAALGA